MGRHLRSDPQAASSQAAQVRDTREIACPHVTAPRVNGEGRHLASRPCFPSRYLRAHFTAPIIAAAPPLPARDPAADLCCVIGMWQTPARKRFGARPVRPAKGGPERRQAVYCSWSGMGSTGPGFPGGMGKDPAGPRPTPRPKTCPAQGTPPRQPPRED